MTLSADIDDTVTTISVADASGMPTLDTDDYMYLTIFKADPEQTEIIKCTAVSSNDLTVVRGQAGTTAQSFNTNDIVAFWVNGKILDRVMGSAGFRKTENINTSTVLTATDLTEGKLLVVEKTTASDVEITLPSTTGLLLEDGIFFGNASPKQGKLVLADAYADPGNLTGDTINGLPTEKTFMNGQGLFRAVPDNVNKIWWVY
jgi:hypothetical protein